MKLLNLYLITCQLSIAVFGLSYRDFQLTENKNGACILADTAGNDTVWDIKVLAASQDLPMIIYDYLDYTKFQNLPNLDEFLNDSYVDGRFNKLLRVNHDGSYTFKLRSGNGDNTLPDTYVNTTITTKTPYKHAIEQPGFYCIYIPKAPNQGKYLIDVEIKDELLPIDTPRYVHAHTKALGVNLVLIFTLSFLQSIWNKQDKKSHKVTTESSNIPVNLITILLFFNTVYLVTLIILEKLILHFYDNPILQSIYLFLNNHVYPLEKSIHDPLFDAFVLLIVSGYGYTQKVPKKFYVLIAIYLSSFAAKYFLTNLQIYIPSDFQVFKIDINDTKYDFFYHSIITAANLNADVKPRLNTLLTPFRFATAFYNSIANNILFPSSILVGLLTLRKLRKTEHNTKPLAYTVLGFLILYSLILKNSLSQLVLPNYKFSGANDFGEVLIVIHGMIGLKLFQCFLFKYLDIAVVYLIWSYFSKESAPKVTKAKLMSSKHKKKKN